MDELQTRILAYTPTDDAKALLKKTCILLLVGPTGSGKNTLEQQLAKTGRFRPIVTHTTRAPRINRGVMETNGSEYYFVSTDQAQEMLKDTKFIEVAFTHEHLYGTSVDEFKLAKEEGKIPVADIDIKGVRSYRRLSDKVIAVFLLPPSFNTMLERLIARYGKSHNRDDIKIRLGTALDELDELLNSDNYYVVVNDQMSATTKTLLDIVDGHVKIKTNPKAMALAQTLIDDIKKYLAS